MNIDVRNFIDCKAINAQTMATDLDDEDSVAMLAELLIKSADQTMVLYRAYPDKDGLVDIVLEIASRLTDIGRVREADKYITEAADIGSLTAHIRMARRYAERGQKREAEKYLAMAAENSCEPAGYTAAAAENSEQDCRRLYEAAEALVKKITPDDESCGRQALEIGQFMIENGCCENCRKLGFDIIRLAADAGLFKAQVQLATTYADYAEEYCPEERYVVIGEETRENGTVLPVLSRMRTFTLSEDSEEDI